MSSIVLSERMKAVADLVTAGNRVCDVGCDHGYVSIYLAKQKLSPRILAMDVREGPLQAAKEHVREYALEEVIETRLSDGLCNFKSGEADSLICAGMGGRLMMSILTRDREKTASFKELILQPQSELEWFRRKLYAEGYRVCAEHMIEEEGKFYPMLRALRRSAGEEEKEPDALEYRYGKLLLSQKSPVLKRFLEKEKENYEAILRQIAQQEGESEKRTERSREIRKRLRDTETALSRLQTQG